MGNSTETSATNRQIIKAFGWTPSGALAGALELLAVDDGLLQGQLFLELSEQELEPDVRGKLLVHVPQNCICVHLLFGLLDSSELSDKINAGISSLDIFGNEILGQFDYC